VAAASSDRGLAVGPPTNRKGQRGPRPEKVAGAPDGCVTPLARKRRTENEGPKGTKWNMQDHKIQDQDTVESCY